MTSQLTVPDRVLNFIQRYFQLKVANSYTEIPYYINESGFLVSPVSAGKGSPDEIEHKIAQKIKNNNEIKNPSDAYELLKTHCLGIDCSGLVYQIYDFWLKNEAKGNLADYLIKIPVWKLRKFISRKFKPQSSVSADELTSEPFAKKIDINEIKSGDLIRTQGGKHVLFIYKIDYEADKPKKIYYVESTKFYEKNGLVRGYIEFEDEINLASAKWTDEGKTNEENHTYKGFRVIMNDNGVFRPKLPILG